MRALRVSAALAVVAPVLLWIAPATAETGKPPVNQRIEIEVYGNDPCPPSTDGEIVVCARRPEGDRYRIPKNLRKKPLTAADGAWANRVATLDDVSRQFLPDSCSVNGSNGQTGCHRAMMHQWYLERQQMKADKAADDAATAP